jgi:hypothetical protein
MTALTKCRAGGVQGESGTGLCAESDKRVCGYCLGGAQAVQCHPLQPGPRAICLLHPKVSEWTPA